MTEAERRAVQLWANATRGVEHSRLDLQVQLSESPTAVIVPC